MSLVVPRRSRGGSFGLAGVWLACLGACSIPQYSSSGQAKDGGAEDVGGAHVEAGRNFPDVDDRDDGLPDRMPIDSGFEGSVPVPESCRDGNRSHGETDVDCGGSECGACKVGRSCLVHSDCESLSCRSFQCASPTCEDGVINQDESAVDCGGQTCAPCAPGQACLRASDCASRNCLDSGTCAIATCADKVKNQDESASDCGGNTCPKCMDGAACGGSNDCQSAVCVAGTCQAASCSDLVKNGTETYPDCGGACAFTPTGQKCGVAQGCLNSGDCASGICFSGVCQMPGCTDGMTDLLETDVDCGGTACQKCPPKAHCEVSSDCQSGVCTGGSCQDPTCRDAVSNGDETDVDCGGGACNPCQSNGRCQRAADCQSKICTNGLCQAASCVDTVQNNGESAEDCGGVQSPPCLRCPPGKTCGQDSDCSSGLCGLSGRCAAASCHDGTQNGGESDIDCGGPNCDPCDNHKTCQAGSDCRSHSCQNLQCAPSTCGDEIKNGTETGRDCGGSCVAESPAHPCGSGEGCGSAIDCSSGVCRDNVCQGASCQPADGVKNGTETDVDCGAAGCPKCADGKSCASRTDCTSGICANGRCAVPSCAPADGVKNGTETDVDCGGSGCPKCAEGAGCETPTDCASGVCSATSNGTCRAATCPDGVKNQGETDVDCGGSNCAIKCGINKACAGDGDCSSSTVCVGGTCLSPTCVDRRQDGVETDVDCGGSCPMPCAVGQKCAVNSDCASTICSGLRCITVGCTNGVKDSAESDVDCGGGTCAKCGTGKTCTSANDCASGVCSGAGTKTCQAPKCSPGDSVKNGTETDVDCGGSSCPKCADNKACAAASDCSSGVCSGSICRAPQCSPADGVKNGNETDTDCGGSTCSVQCADSRACLLSRDCVNTVCYVSSGVGATAVANTCTGSICTGGSCRSSSCSDGLWGGSESDVDCGGSCPKCTNGKKCSADVNCSSNVCNLSTKICQALGCSPGDGRANGSETDVDCGGGACPACANGLHCVQRSDCASGGACSSGICQPATCLDVIQNQAETDVDCGGPHCGKCADNQKCSDANDCLSGVCTRNLCKPGTCADSVPNNGESDVDCGGSQNPLCSRCAEGKTCRANSDCASGSCTNLTCDPSTLKVQYAHPDDESPTNGEVKPYFNILNTGASAVALAELMLRYWFYQDGSATFVKNCYYAACGCNATSMQFYALSPTRTGADYYLEITFGSGTIAAGTAAEFKVEFNHPNYAPAFSETAHYSYNGNTSYADWSRVTLYRNGTLVWGLEP